MGTLCSNVRPRYKIYVIGVFDGKIDDLCSFANLYPNQLPRIGRYLLKQLNIRVQQNKSNKVQKDIDAAMRAWNDLIYACNIDIEKFESHILQSMILLFAQESVQLHVLAMKTLRKYLPYSRKMSVDELLSFVDSCTVLAESSEVSIRIDALKTLSIIFTHLHASFCPDLYTKYEAIIRVTLVSMNIDEEQCHVYGEHCYEQFCTLISTNTLPIMLNALSLILCEYYSWKPTRFVIKLLDILSERGSSIAAISIVGEILHMLSILYTEDHGDESFVEYMDRLSTMDSMISTLQEFASRVIGTKQRQNRNPILSKLCSFLHIIDDISAVDVTTDSMDISTQRMVKFAHNLLDCIQHYVIDISYMDSQSVLLRMIKHLSGDATSTVTHSELQLKCILRTLAHRTGTVRCSQQTQDDILKCLLRFHLAQQYKHDSDHIIELVQLSIQNLLLLSPHNTQAIAIGFHETKWAITRIAEFLELQIKIFGTASHEEMSSSSSTITSSPDRNSNLELNISQQSIQIDGFMIYKLTYYQREWIYATIYSYLENVEQTLDETTLLRITCTIIIVAISPHNFNCNKSSSKIHSEVIDFELLLPFLGMIHKLAETSQCHSIVRSVLLYIRRFLRCHYSRKTNYSYLFGRFCEITDNFCCVQNELEVQGKILISAAQNGLDIDVSFEDLIESLSMYFELIDARRRSISTRDSHTAIIKKEFPVALIINHLLQEQIEPDLEASLSGISQSIQQQRYVASTFSFDADHHQMHPIHLNNEDYNNDQMEQVQALDELKGFEEMTVAYCAALDQLDKIRLSVTSTTPAMHTSRNPMIDSLNSETQTKSFTFSEAAFLSQTREFFTFESRPSAVESRCDHRHSDLSHFYVEFENQENTASVLHDGLSNRLDLMDLVDDMQPQLPALEYELNELINYERYTHMYTTPQDVLEDSGIQSPMRQLKAKGKSAVNHIRNRTRQLTQHMSVRNISNLKFKNTPNAIREKTNAIREKTKEKFQTVKTKMFKHKKDEGNMMENAPPHVYVQDVDIEMITKNDYDQSENENSFILSEDTMHSMSYTPSKGSINTIYTDIND
eukprot:55781_1